MSQTVNICKCPWFMCRLINCFIVHHCVHHSESCAVDMLILLIKLIFTVQ